MFEEEDYDTDEHECTELNQKFSGFGIGMIFSGVWSTGTIQKEIVLVPENAISSVVFLDDVKRFRTNI